MSVAWILDSSAVLLAWCLVAAACVAVVVADLRRNNPQLGGLMKAVWVLTVAYSGPLGLAGYFWSGRRQIGRDSLARRAFRSVAHCYSGCGAGEIAGVYIAAGLFSLGNTGIAVISFTLAYAAGFALTVGPLVQDGVALPRAVRDAFYSDTARITVMEVVAIGVDLWLGGGARMGEARFWSSLIVSLSAGLAAAYPVNVVLVALGVKEGMHSPTHAH